jgi:hypothetical protein
MSYIPAVTSWKPRACQSCAQAVPAHFLWSQLLLDRFPHVREVSEQLLKDSEPFRELSEEYEACTEAIERLEPSATSAGLLIEYRALRLRLEGELLRCVCAHYAARDAR